MRLPCTRCWTAYRTGEAHRPADAAAVHVISRHVDPASTYWYLEAVPELLELVGQRLERLPGVVS